MGGSTTNGAEVDDLLIQGWTMEADWADDLRLARCASASDEQALNKIYELYADLLFAFIYHSLGGTPADAEEIWQDTWLAAFRSIGRYSGKSRLFTWLCGIARHKLMDYYRYRYSGIQPFVELHNECLDTLIDTEPLPEEVVMNDATRVCVVEALTLLPEDQRRALLSRYVEGRSVEEIARLLGKSYKATESLLSRARVAFREIFVSMYQEEQHG